MSDRTFISMTNETPLSPLPGTLIPPSHPVSRTHISYTFRDLSALLPIHYGIAVSLAPTPFTHRNFYNDAFSAHLGFLILGRRHGIIS